MPGLNSTGPRGQGPGTGRKLGKCNTEIDTDLDEITVGRRFGRGFRNRNGFGKHVNCQGGQRKRSGDARGRN